jgi:hypothetical protein
MHSQIGSLSQRPPNVALGRERVGYDWKLVIFISEKRSCVAARKVRRVGFLASLATPMAGNAHCSEQYQGIVSQKSYRAAVDIVCVLKVRVSEDNVASKWP